jgi:hypothetical protein
VLDPAGYGAVTIDRSVSIVDDGVGEAGIQATSGGSAITINAGSTDIIHLRGLTLDGAGVAANGIQFNSGGSLTVVNCVIRNFTSTGINLAPLFGMSFFISDTFVSDNQGNAIAIFPQGITTKGTFDRVKAVNNANGISVDGSNATGTIDITINNSVIASNKNNGLYAYTISGSSSPVVRLGQTMISENAFGIAGAALVSSYGDNKIYGNGSDVSGGGLITIPMH